jgi:crotonobetainyl-CoA:carnitine CoA-transferase CaiB-like acyl-CoA transferase
MHVDSGGPLAGVRVLDASRVLAGPLCGMILGDLGADVIKIERPGSGDETRAWGPPFQNDLSAYYLSCNRNKRSVTLDLMHAEGRHLLAELARQSDVLLENFLPASAAKLGLTPAALHAINPRLIVCSISGFGRTGPLREAPGYDFALQAMSGLMSITGPVDGQPYKVGVAIADVVAGMNAAIATLACLHARHQSGHGYAIDIALLDSTVAAQVNVAQAFLSSGEVIQRQGNAHLQIVPYQLFDTADGHIVLAVGNDGQWQRFCRAARRDDLLQDQRFETNPQRVQLRAELLTLIEPLMRSHSTSEWQAILTAAEVPHSPVLNHAEVFAHPQATARGLKVTVHDLKGNAVNLVNTPFRIAGATLPAFRAPPPLGADTESVLREMLNVDGPELNRLREARVI